MKFVDLFIKHKISNPFVIDDDVTTTYMRLVRFHDNMVKSQTRYKELQILVKNCDTSDLKGYNDELKENISIHLSRDFGFKNFESDMDMYEALKLYAKSQPHLKHPDLDFASKIETGEIASS